MPIEHSLYMKLLKGVDKNKGKGKMHVLKFIRNLYGQKQAGRVWNRYLTNKLLAIVTEQSAIGE